MGWLVLGLALLFGMDGGGLAAPPTPPVSVVDGGAAVPDPSPDDSRLLEDLELLRQYDLLKVYPLIAPD